jgi:hypothetical protein
MSTVPRYFTLGARNPEFDLQYCAPFFFSRELFSQDRIKL